ncbi:MAG: ATP-binding cassette domain-containing protein [Actinobacteria bacterium]|nr:ATP-binding cassette domain-containing protein [Actinomycetota bacterium]
MIEARGLVKKYGDVVALDGLDLSVPEGTVYGLLGPNGAGKTTAVRILTTLLKPDAGTAKVDGLDVVRKANAVRRIIGLTGQYAAVDEYLTGRENLRMFGDLYHLPTAYVKERSDELLARFDLTDAADRSLRTYSGGMRRRLDLAASLIAKPRVLFLDEPTTGLDPRSRIDLWEVIKDLVADGTTVLLTTQYLEEADQLAEEIVVIDHGRVIAQGTSDTLKDQVGGDRLEIVVDDPAQMDAAAQALRSVATGEVTVDRADHRIVAPVVGGSLTLVDAVRSLDAAHVGIADVALRRPTLDDVFLSLTGHTAEEDQA